MHTLLPVLATTVVLALGIVANESTHGGLSKATGLGHHHMLDYGGYHCAGHEPRQAQDGGLRQEDARVAQHVDAQTAHRCNDAPSGHPHG